MTSEGSGEMFEGDFADTCTSAALMSMGPSGGSSMRRPGSKDPHRRERNSKVFMIELVHLYYQYGDVNVSYSMYTCQCVVVCKL